MTSNRSLLVVGAIVVALSVTAIVAAVAVGDRTAPVYAVDTPEGTLQRYLAAWDDEDLPAAHAYFSSNVRRAMDLRAFERARDSWEEYSTNDAQRVLFESSRIDGDEATVVLAVEQFSGEGLDGSAYRYERQVRLVREDGAWRIDEPLVWLDPAPVEPAPAAKSGGA